MNNEKEKINRLLLCVGLMIMFISGFIGGMSTMMYVELMFLDKVEIDTVSFDINETFMIDYLVFKAKQDNLISVGDVEK